MALADLLEALGGRVKRRQGNAHDQLLEAADAHARGDAVDVDHLEQALHNARLTPADFEQLCRQRVERQGHLKTFDGLHAARTAAGKLQKQIDAANDRFAEARNLFERDYGRLRQQQAEHERAIARAETARDWLLNPKHVAGAMRLDYEAAIEAEQQAQEAEGEARRQVKQLREDIASERGWIEQLAGEQAGSLSATDPAHLRQLAKALEPSVIDKIEQHTKRKARLEQRLVEAENELKAAEKATAAAARELERLQKLILAAK